jgi:hypothetical protein
MAYVKERDKDLMILMALYRVSGNHWHNGPNKLFKQNGNNTRRLI